VYQIAVAEEHQGVGGHEKGDRRGIRLPGRSKNLSEL
jgi:hypothetical protein